MRPPRKKVPFLLREADHGGISEKKAIKSVKGRLTPASGALVGAKGDGTAVLAGMSFRIEHKATRNQSISLKKEWLDKITKEALEMGEVPMLMVSFVLPSGHLKVGGDWCLVPRHVLKELMDDEEVS